MNLKRIFKLFLEFTLVLGVIFVFAHLTSFAVDNQTLPLSQEAVDEYKKGLIPGPYGTEVDSIELVEEFVLENVLGYVKIIIGVIAILFITITGYALIMGGAEEEKVTNAKKGMIFAIVALILVSMSQDIAKIFDMEDRTFFQTPSEIIERVKIFDSQVQIIITFIKYIIAAFAALMIVASAISLITSGGNEEEVTKHRNSIMYSIGALLLVYAGEIFINKVFYRVDLESYSAQEGIDISIDPAQGVKEIAGITNFVVSFIGPVAILMLIVGAIMYITAGGEDTQMERAKRILIATGVGIIIIYGAFAVVSTIIAGSLEGAAESAVGGLTT